MCANEQLCLVWCMSCKRVSWVHDLRGTVALEADYGITMQPNYVAITGLGEKFRREQCGKMKESARQRTIYFFVFGIVCSPGPAIGDENVAGTPYLPIAVCSACSTEKAAHGLWDVGGSFRSHNWLVPYLTERVLRGCTHKIVGPYLPRSEAERLSTWE